MRIKMATFQEFMNIDIRVGKIKVALGGRLF